MSGALELSGCDSGRINYALYSIDIDRGSASIKVGACESDECVAIDGSIVGANSSDNRSAGECVGDGSGECELIVTISEDSIGGEGGDVGDSDIVEQYTIYLKLR